MGNDCSSDSAADPPTSNGVSPVPVNESISVGDLERYFTEMKESEELKADDKKYRLRTYQRVLIGSELVDWMLKRPWCSSRAQAVSIGNALLKRSFIHHVTHDQPFKDDYYFYRLQGEEVKLNAAERESKEWDLIVVGAGSGGLTAALFAAQVGARVLLVERHRVGGDCTWSGCVPSKALLHVGKVAHHARTGVKCGVHTGDVKVDMQQVHDYIQNRIRTVYALESTEHLEKKGVIVEFANASFVDAHSLRLTPTQDSAKEADNDDNKNYNDETRSPERKERIVTAHHILLCTGAHPSIPPTPGLDKVPFITYEQVFTLRELPPRLCVIGAGPIGCELAQAFARLGSQVTQVASKLLRRESDQVRAIMQEIWNREGISILEGRPTSISGTQVGDDADGKYEITVETKTGSTVCDVLLVATGRAPNLDGLNLEAANIEFTKKGIKVDQFLQTTCSSVYAAGDCTGGYQFTHYAGWQAFQAARNILAPGNDSGHNKILPWVTFTDPEIAQVGMGEEEARELYGDEVRVLRWSNEKIDRAVCDSDDLGFTQLIGRDEGPILGAQIVNQRAGEVIAELCVAIANKLTFKQVATSIHPYPTYSFGVMQITAESVTDYFLSHTWGGKYVKSSFVKK